MKMKLKCSKSQKATNKKRVSRKSKAMEKHLEKKGCDYEWKLGSFLFSRKATGARARVSLAFCMLFPCFFLAFSLLCMRVSWSPRTHLSAQLLLFFFVFAAVAGVAVVVSKLLQNCWYFPNDYVFAERRRGKVFAPNCCYFFTYFSFKCCNNDFLLLFIYRFCNCLCYNCRFAFHFINFTFCVAGLGKRVCHKF